MGTLRLFLLALTLSVYTSPVFPDETLSLRGLQAPVEILKDKWGVSHIYAQNQKDLFFAQGYNAARDRLFQFEIWRRRALGTLAEIQGVKAVAHDEGARLLRYRGDLEKELNHYHPDGAEIVNAFVEGVNAYIDQANEDPESLPIEFGALGITPGRWTAEVVISRHNALTGGLSTEVMLAETITALGEQMTARVLPFAREATLVSKPGIDLSLITKDVMAKYRASRTPPPFDATTDPTTRLAALNNQDDHPLLRAESVGSNNWVIAGSRTASGKPLMANDPHRQIQTPSLRYMVHLYAPGPKGESGGEGWNVIGAGEPTLPGVSIGHNEYGAWGLTIFAIDQEDLYVHEINPDNPDQYRYQGKWRDMDIEETVIPVRDAAPVQAKLRYTVFGPVIHEDTDKALAYALKAVWLEQGAAPYLASLRMDQASSWESFRAACEYSGLPGENMVWADAAGNIGWQSVGYTPIRFGWDGRLPVPGDGEFEWQGLVPIRSMPHILNPDSGWYGTANHNNVPEHYPNIFADFYSDPARSYRLKEVLSQTSGHTVTDSSRLQYDTKSMTAEQITPLILDLQRPQALEKAFFLLETWDYRMDRESVGALIYDKWELIMLRKLNEKVLPGQEELVGRPKLLEWLAHPPEFLFGENAAVIRDKMMLASLAEAVSQLSKELGADESQWQYGRVHVAEIEHPLSHTIAEVAQLKHGPLPRGGASNTLNANRGNDRQTAGASFRIIVDTADWDKTVATNTPGQSGNPASSHYGDLFEAWNEGRYFPLFYSREKIESVTTERLLLEGMAPSASAP
ncbi:MAG: penicillin amidase [Glaciecola sp.]|uniref:penicillin acylase family protein n=1 Tax=Congregibacter sp. TaxID=2744308 RepID=UPI0039E5C0D4